MSAKTGTKSRRFWNELKPDLRAGMTDGPALATYFHSRLALAEKAERLMMSGGDDLGLVTSARLTGSYAMVVDFDRDTYAMKIGADTVSHIPDEKLRAAFADLIQRQNDNYVRFQYIDTDFRRLVLRLYPARIAYKIVEACNLGGIDDLDAVMLRPVSTTDCEVDLPAGDVARLAATLRADRDALGLVREHINRMRTISGRIDRFEGANRAVLVAMDELPAPPVTR